MVQALLNTRDEEVSTQASYESALVQKLWRFAWEYAPPFSVFLGSHCVATYLKHASELDIFGRTKALVLRLITLDAKYDQEWYCIDSLTNGSSLLLTVLLQLVGL